MDELPRTFDEVEVGDVFDVEETYEVTEAEIVEFAERWDPQPFHVDPEAAEDSMFGGLVASGWHTCAMGMRLLVDGLISKTGSMAALGVDDLRWVQPVRPGDVLRIEVEVVEKKPFREESGLVYNRVKQYAGDDLVLSYVGRTLWPRGDG